ncbi:helix-turn-helix domain-containing protein [Nonomuraea sp. NPDC001699]
MALFWQRGAGVTGIAEVVQATRLSRSSLYATFGGKAQLRAAALGRYLERQSRPVFDALAADALALRARVPAELVEALRAGRPMTPRRGSSGRHPCRRVRTCARRSTCLRQSPPEIPTTAWLAPASR